MALILKDLDLVEPLAALPEEKYLRHPIHEPLAERYLERMSQSTSTRSWRSSTGYRPR